MQRHRIIALAIATALVALPAASQQGKGPKTQVFIDVATHDFAGMPSLGGLGGFMMRRMGGDKGPQAYPESRRVPAATGKYLDIALYNGLKPGVEAQQFVPAGLDVGKSLPLVPPTTQQGEHGKYDPKNVDVDVTFYQYWGCGAAVRPGQPKVFHVKMKDGQMQSSGGMAPGLFVPDRDIDATPAYAVWPNRKNTRRVSDDSSMVGAHSIVGDGVPESLKFDLDRNADFMPRISLRSQGGPEDAIAVSWQPVDRARAYFLTAFGAKSQHEFVMWSSSDVAGAGNELLNYLTGSYVDKWLKQKVLLPTSATSCTVPKGIFASSGGADAQQGGMGGMGMLTMIAYGPETNIAWPPRPANPKTPWNPEWNVRVRTKSTASALLGMDMGDMPRDGDQQQPKKKPSVRGLLKGILGGG
ncbi:MAG TPA: hypothetical protein VFI26_00820 [Lysobacter sp.]|nr:hypothetical protein [Lysobacter sp.]